MARDLKVRFRREESIEKTASIWRDAAGHTSNAYFNIVDFAARFLSRNLKNSQPLQIKLFDARPDDDLAYVDFNPLTLHVDKEIRELAEKGDPFSRYIIAHEIGHILLHRDFRKAFSQDPNTYIQYEMNECSAEWQANKFASYFLLPTHIVVGCGDAQLLAEACSVPLSAAKDRIKAVFPGRSRAILLKGYEGEACSECGNFTLLRNGTFSKCTMCGGTTDSS